MEGVSEGAFLEEASEGAFPVGLFLEEEFQAGCPAAASVAHWAGDRP